MQRTAINVWLGLCALVAGISAIFALNAFPDMAPLAPGRYVPGSPIGTEAFWQTLLRFQQWAFIACFAAWVGLLSLRIMRQQQVRVVLVVCIIVGLWYGRGAIDRIMITASFNGSGATGTWVWWYAYLEFQQAAWRSLGSLSLGMVIATVAAWWSKRSPDVPAVSPELLTDQ